MTFDDRQLQPVSKYNTLFVFVVLILGGIVGTILVRIFEKY